MITFTNLSENVSKFLWEVNYKDVSENNNSHVRNALTKDNSN